MRPEPSIAGSNSRGYRAYMEKDRLGAFSVTVLAIVITITVIELRAPVEASLSSLRVPAFETS